MRHPRLIVPDHPHHVILRGNNRRRLFSYPNDYFAFIHYLSDALDRHGGWLHALTLMSNHVHILITPGADLSKLIAMLSMRYAQRRNRRYDGSGKLFESRFASFPVLGEGQLALTTAYIENNPVRAGMRDDPAEYPYSTHALHTGLGRSAIPRRIWSPTDWYRSLGDTDEERAACYRKWVLDCLARGSAPERVSRLAILEAISAHGRDCRLRRPNQTRAS